MKPQDFLPDNDQDLQLALAIGKANEGSTDFTEVQDDLLASLLNYKEQVQQEETRIDIPSSKIWDEIENQMDAQPAKIHTLGSKKSNNIQIWAMAATVLVAAFISIFWIINLGSPTLIGESGAELATVQLKDGSSVTLRPYTKIWENEYSDTEQIYTINGEAYFDVVSNPEREFSVESADARVTVLGTRFIFSNWGTTGSVYLEEGKVRFETIDQSSAVELQPGEKSEIQNGEVTEPELANADSYIDWLDNVLFLDGQTVSETFSELEQHFNISISSQIDIYSEIMGGSFTLQNVDQTLNDLATVLSGTFRKTGENEYLFIPLN